jgi:DNA (cytosine-5)-methyltransferase 1
MNHLDLFSGIGGFALAAKWAGFETIAFCEIDPFCRKVLIKNFPGVLKYMDIKDIANPDHVDLLTAGFPCQPFSVAGKKKGKEDERYLWPETLRIIKLSQPTWIVLENVPGIIPHLDPILKDLERESYAWRAYLIPASAVGAPHKRERIWIIAHRDSERCDKRIDNREERYIQDDWKRHIEAIQSEWPQCQPQSWSTFNTQEWLGSITDFSSVGCGSLSYEDQTVEKNKRQFKTSLSNWQSSKRFNWQKDQPPISGVDDGVSFGLDRNRALGNAIVPQVVYPILKIIYLIENKLMELPK